MNHERQAGARLMQRCWLLLALLLSSVTVPAMAHGGSGGSGGSVYVHGYYRGNGTYVQPHYRSAPDGNFWNNWSTKGNVNPYTGVEGTKVTPPNSYGGSHWSQTSPGSGYGATGAGGSYPSASGGRYPDPGVSGAARSQPVYPSALLYRGTGAAPARPAVICAPAAAAPPGEELTAAAVARVQLRAAACHANEYVKEWSRIDGEIVNGTTHTLTLVTVRFVVREHGQLVIQRRLPFRVNIPPGSSQTFDSPIDLPREVARDLYRQSPEYPLAHPSSRYSGGSPWMGPRGLGDHRRRGARGRVKG